MEYRTKEDYVAEYLREGIISGRFERGARLKQAEIAETLRLSITPVREALKLLEAEGYIVGDSFRGATVAPFDIEASSEVLSLRILLETQLVRGAVDHAKAEDIAELQVLAAEFAGAYEAGNNEGARSANYRFHHRMYDIARMPQTLHFVQILWARYPFDLINRLEGRVRRAASEHDEVLAALIAGDSAAAMLATREHIRTGFEELRNALAAEQAAAPERMGKAKKPQT